MKARTEMGFLLGLTGIVVAFVCYQPDPRMIIMFLIEVLGYALVGLFATALVYYQIFQPIRKRLYMSKRGNTETVLSASQSEDKERWRQEAQKNFVNDAKIFQQKQEERRKEAFRKKEQEYYRFLHPVFNSTGKLLKDADTAVEDHSNVTSRSASERKNQSKLNMCKGLPVEPSEGEPGSVLISFRTPKNNQHKRRFLITDTVEEIIELQFQTHFNPLWTTVTTNIVTNIQWVLHAFVLSLGYRPSLYQLLTTYPQSNISTDPSLTLEQLNLTKQSLLTISEIDDDS